MVRKFRLQIVTTLLAYGIFAHFAPEFAFAQPCVINFPLTTLNNPAPVPFDYYGTSVAVDGNFAAIGASGDDPGGVSGSGSAYVVNVSSGVVQSILTNPTSAENDAFGASIDAWGLSVVVGAPNDNPGEVDDAGSVYVFHPLTGELLATLNNPFPATMDGFGFDVAISGNLVVVGAPNDDPGGATNSGSAFVCDITDHLTSPSIPLVLTPLINPASTNNDNFGFSVAISGTSVLVGSPGENSSGGAYVFNATTGALVVTLDNPTPASGDKFGCDVAISDTWAAVGACGDSSDGVAGAGIAYIYGPDFSYPVSTIRDPTPTENEFFGVQLGFGFGIMVVGSEFADVDGVGDAGTCHVFDPASGNLLVTLDNPTPQDEDWFGSSVDVSETCIIVGAANDNPGDVTDAGCAYLFATGDNAAFVSHTIPAQVPENYYTPISITFCNTGGTEWSAENQYELFEISDDCSQFFYGDFELYEAVPPGSSQPFYAAAHYFYGSGSCEAEFQMARAGIPFGQPVICTFEVVPAFNDADLVNHTFPDELDTEDSLTFTLVVKNIGNTTWIPDSPDGISSAKASPDLLAGPPGSNHALGVFGSDECGLFSQSRFAPIGIISPNKNFMAFVHITAPATPGECSFTLRMVEEGVGWFGETFTHTITIEEPPNSARNWAIYQ